MLHDILFLHIQVGLTLLAWHCRPDIVMSDQIFSFFGLGRIFLLMYGFFSNLKMHFYWFLNGFWVFKNLYKLNQWLLFFSLVYNMMKTINTSLQKCNLTLMRAHLQVQRLDFTPELKLAIAITNNMYFCLLCQWSGYTCSVH